MPLTAGTQLGPYEIVSPIGKGGMGEVYRARDTKLGRDVAIKVLPEELANDAERVARFEREAKLLASLNHPNIAAIYGFEQNALVLELVEGPTLAERIEQGPVPVDEAIAIAKQITYALEAGHEAGIIHRDLKPANIKLKEDGTVKVLDYGLAKALEGEAVSAADSELSQSPTLTRQGTQIGVILGTAAYMSPEQAKGKRVDKRADVWAFGAVLYEMLTGKRAFAGEDVTDTLAYVLTKEPDWSALPSDTPSSLHLVLRVCLTKDLKVRVRDIADARLAMSGVFQAADAPKGRLDESGWRPSIFAAAVFALALAAITGLAIWSSMPETPRSIARFTITLPSGETFDNAPGDGRRQLALSPDGARLVLSMNRQLHVRSMDQMLTTPIRGTEGARNPFFSPNGEWVGFWSGGQLKKVSVHAGAPVVLCDIRPPLGAQWRADDTIIFGDVDGGIVKVSASGGEPAPLIALEDANGRQADSPQMLPGDKSVLFTLGANNNWDNAQIVVQSLETGARKVLIEGGRAAQYIPTGHLVYILDGTLLAAPFDIDELTVTGPPVTIVENVMLAGSSVSGAAQYSVSDNGSLAYVSAGLGDPERVLVWVDRDGNEEGLAAGPGLYFEPRIAPGGDRLAVAKEDEENDIWIWDFSGEFFTRFTFDPAIDTAPVWTRDGAAIVFESHRGGQGNLFVQPSRGSGEAKRLTQSANHQSPLSIAPDGTSVLIEDRTGHNNIALVPLSGESPPQPLHPSEFNETNAEISPDGRWIAYQSDESGQSEIYVRPFPELETNLRRVSRDGGTRPVWAPNGRELFYVGPDRRLRVAAVSMGQSFTAGPPELALTEPYAFDINNGRNYDISPDGTRFLVLKEVERDETSSPQVILVQNWFEELKRLVPSP